MLCGEEGAPLFKDKFYFRVRWRVVIEAPPAKKAQA